MKKNKVNYRHYQENIIKRCSNKNTLLALPTGLGKTIIGILLTAKALEKYPKSKIVILAPTRPLVSQHKSSYQKFLDIKREKISAFTGKIHPEKRIILFKNSQIIISTPQIIKNDIERGRYNLKHVSLLIFDEGHRTKGNYAYKFISNEYINTCSDPLVLALTASPGKDYSHIQQLCDNLFIENVIFKSYEDKDVKKYIYDIDIFLEYVNVPIKVLKISAVWYNLFEKYLKLFIKWQLIPPNKPYYSKTDFLGIAQDLTLSLRYENGLEPDLSEEEYFNLLYYQKPKIIDRIKAEAINIQTIYSYCSSCISLLHGKDLLETQNYSLFESFLERIESKSEQDILSAKRIINSDHYKFIKNMLRHASVNNVMHPKLEKISSIIKEEIQEYNNYKILIFTQFREMAELLKIKLTNEFGAKLNLEKFIGQASKDEDLGFPQSKQIKTLNQFREGKINILIATSIAEEGLDIPNVDAVIFYEPVPSEIRFIQRRGRTGRHAPGRCYILITRETTDVPFHKVALRKENTMNYILSRPQNLNLCKDIERHEIDFQKQNLTYKDSDFIKIFKERKEKEKEILTNRSVDEIITEIDNFVKSDEYKKLKDHGIIYFNDLIKINKKNLKKSLSKIKGRKSKQAKKNIPRINKKIKTLINLIKTYGKNGALNYSKFKKLARQEEIFDTKFDIHFNQACYLGFIRKQAKKVHLSSDYE